MRGQERQGLKHINGDKQMTDVWHLPAIARWEKACGKHPTQKPLSLLVRMMLASTYKGAWVLDPFAGSCTTGIAANLLGRRFLGIDKEEGFLSLGRNRKLELEQPGTCTQFRSKLKDLARLDCMATPQAGEECVPYGDLPF